MKRILIILAVLSGCAAHQLRPHHLMAAAGTTLTANQVSFFRGNPDPPTPGSVAIVSTDGINLLQQNSDGTTASLGGSSSGTVTNVTGTAPIAVATGTTTPVVSIAASTDSVPGSMSATDKTFVDYISGRWEWVAQRFMLAKVAALTDFQYIKVGQLASGDTIGAFANDGNCEGGCLSVGSSANSESLGTSIFQSTSGGHWAFRYRAKLLGPTSGKTILLGIANATGTHQVAVESVFATDATHLVLHIVGGGTTDVVSTFVGDGAFHNFTITDDATTVTLWVDDVSYATTATRTNLTTEPMYQFWYNTTVGEVLVAKFDYGYVTP